jgi:hypothetical protein
MGSFDFGFGPVDRRVSRTVDDEVASPNYALQRHWIGDVALGPPESF